MKMSRQCTVLSVYISVRQIACIMHNIQLSWFDTGVLTFTTTMFVYHTSELGPCLYTCLHVFSENCKNSFVLWFRLFHKYYATVCTKPREVL